MGDRDITHMGNLKITDKMQKICSIIADNTDLQAMLDEERFEELYFEVNARMPLHYIKNALLSKILVEGLNIGPVRILKGIGDTIPTNMFCTVQAGDDITIPDNIKYIAVEGLNGASFRNIHLNRVENVNRSAFYGCPLNNVYATKSLKNVYLDAFNSTGCCNFYYDGTIEEFNRNVRLLTRAGDSRDYGSIVRGIICTDWQAKPVTKKDDYMAWEIERC